MRSSMLLDSATDTGIIMIYSAALPAAPSEPMPDGVG
jgi:hypothetical protein